MSTFLANVPRVTRNLIIINILVFIATMLNQSWMMQTFALFYPTSQLFRWWQPLTHMFMHGGFWHILFNMYTLWMFGSVVENYIGEKKYLLFYFVCGLGAAALHLGVQAIEAASYTNGIAIGAQAAINNYAALKYTPTVGASGAIYGVIIAYALLFPQSRLTLIFPPVTLNARTMVIVFAAIELFTGIGNLKGIGIAGGVAHFAHLGGMLFGWMLMKYWRDKGTLFDRENF